MPEYIRSLIVILVLSSLVFSFARRPASAIIGSRGFERRRNLWFVLTVAAFLSHNFWLYTIIAIPLIVYTNRQDHNPAALFFFVLFTLPVASIKIPGMGIINFLFEISNLRLLELFVLLPAAFILSTRGNSLRYGRSTTDTILFVYGVISLLLYLRGSTFTDTMRESFYMFLDVFLPYFVFSRSLHKIEDFREVLFSYLVAIMVVALIAIFEFVKHWLLYPSLLDALDMSSSLNGYLDRDGMLRVIASTGQPIVLGYLMVVGIGFYLFLKGLIKQKMIRRLGFLLLSAGLFVPLSRGPWIGAVVLYVAFLSAGRKAIRYLALFSMTGLIALLLVAILPGGERIINLLPFIGNTEKSNVDYREQLITNATIVIKRNPWFGSPDYMDTPEMESMRQGQGIIDIVNSYIGILLSTGLTGLACFVGFFATTLLRIRGTMRLIQDRNSEEYLLGRILMATLISILVMIFTVSSISFIPTVYWSIAGMGLAYTQMLRKQKDREESGNLAGISHIK